VSRIPGEKSAGTQGGGSLLGARLVTVASRPQPFGLRRSSR